MFSLGMIGGGAMGSALLNGIIQAGLITPKKLYLVETDPTKREVLKVQIGVNLIGSLPELASECPTIILAVKPQVIPIVLSELDGLVKQNHLLISIAAGVTLSNLQNYLPQGRFVRVMPNTPAKIGYGVAAYCQDSGVSAEECERVEAILKCVGQVLKLPEHLMDAVTAVSGSGPAYVFYFMEALIDAAVMLGLNRADARVLVVETVRGAAEMMKQTTDHPAVLRNEVTSPAGTTAAGLFELEKAAFAGTIGRAVIAAAQKSKELGK